MKKQRPCYKALYLSSQEEASRLRMKCDFYLDMLSQAEALLSTSRAKVKDALRLVRKSKNVYDFLYAQTVKRHGRRMINSILREEEAKEERRARLFGLKQAGEGGEAGYERRRS